MSSYITATVRIWAGIACLLVSLFGQAFPHIAQGTSTHVCEYVTCRVYFNGARERQPLNPTDYAAAQTAAAILFDLVEQHFGTDVLLGS